MVLTLFMQFYKVIEDLLSGTDKFTDKEGKLIKSLVVDSAYKSDSDLIKLLITNEQAKTKFFKEIAGFWVFNINDFILFIQDKNFLDDSYTRFKNKIGLNIDNKFLKQRGEVALVWPYKDCVLEGSQDKEDTKHQEIFFNEVLAGDEIDRLLDPKVLVNWTRHTTQGEIKPNSPLEGWQTKSDGVFSLKRHLDGTLAENLLIKGNNLLALHTLKKQFRNKVKLIYIDPPYNTGNDGFKYNDRFNHSTWLTFMKNRLEVAKELLRDDGVIFVQCDDNEQAYLKVLMDEVFGRENFVSDVAVRSSTPSGLKTAHKEKTIIKQRDSILCFSKNSVVSRFKPQYEKKNSWDSHYMYFFDRENNQVLKLKDVLLEKNLIKENQKLDDLNILDKDFNKFYIKYKENIFRTAPEMPKDIKIKSKNNPEKIIEYGDNENINYAWNGNRMTFLSRAVKKIDGEECLGNLLCDFWGDIDFQNTQNEGSVSLQAGKKPEKLLQRIIEMSTEVGDIILDFHAGSGTTGAVANKMGRQWIMVEQMDYIENITKERLKKVIGRSTPSPNDDTPQEGNFRTLTKEEKIQLQEILKKL